MEATAKLRNIPMSARKMRLVINNVRGKSVNEALEILKYTKNEGAVWCSKLIKSAAANWAYASEDDSAMESLYIKSIQSDEGTVLKRFQPAPHCRAHRIRKRMNHVTVVVDTKEINA